MEELVKMVSEKTGISEAQAASAVNTVLGFIKDKLPAGMSAQVESYIKGESTGGVGDIKDKIGMFGK